MTTLDAQQIIGDTVTNPQSVKPLREDELAHPVPKSSFFIIGGAKCGSTTLTTVLARHPDCCHSAPKETNFFTLNFDRGWDWYRGTFSHYNGEPIVGEASVSYAHIPSRKNVAKQIFEYNPDAKIIHICRHPWEKLVSGWKMALTGPGYLAHFSAKQGFEEYVLHEEERVDFGPWENPTHGWSQAEPSGDRMTRIWLNAIHYEGQIDNYLRFFPPEQVKVMFLKDLKEDQDREADSLCRFVGLDPARLPAPEAQSVNRADERRQYSRFYQVIANSDALRPLRHLFPKDLRLTLRQWLKQSPLGSRKMVYPDLEMSDSFRTDLVGYLKAKSASFLERNGKPADFWDFDNLS